TASLPSFTHPATTEIYTLSLHDALPICALVVPDHHRDVPARPELELLRALRILGPEQARSAGQRRPLRADLGQAHGDAAAAAVRSEEHTSELQSRRDLVCRLLLEKKKKI